MVHHSPPNGIKLPQTTDPPVSNSQCNTPISQKSEKRKLTEETITLKTMNDSLQNQLRGISNHLFGLKSSTDENFNTLNGNMLIIHENIAKVNKKIEDVKSWVSEDIKKVDEKISEVRIASIENQQNINYLFQINMDKMMEIEGIDPYLLDNAPNKKSVAIDTIRSLNIQIVENDIISASVKNFTKTKNNTKHEVKILIVQFASFEEKIRIMRARKTVRNHRNIYFSHVFTPHNRNLYLKARKISIQKNLKYYFAGGKVNVVRLDGKAKWIASDEDLKEFEAYPSSTKTNHPASAFSTHTYTQRPSTSNNIENPFNFPPINFSQTSIPQQSMNQPQVINSPQPTAQQQQIQQPIDMNSNINSKYFTSLRKFTDTEKINKNLKIFQLNVRGINKLKKFERVKKLISTLKAQIDVIILTETKLRSKCPRNLYNLPGFQSFFCCSQRTASGGVLMFVNKSLNPILIESHTSSFDMLTIFLSARKLNIVGCYRPPNSSIKDFFPTIESYLQAVTGNFLIFGDINIDVNSISRKQINYLHLLTSYKAKVINKHITRDESATTIDHVVTNMYENTIFNIHTISIDKTITDHNIVITEIINCRSGNLKHCVTRTKTHFKKLIPSFKKNMTNTQQIIDNKLDLVHATENLVNALSRTVKECEEKVHFKCHEKNSCWQSTKLLKLKKSRRNLRTRIRRSNNNCMLLNELKKKDSEIRHLQRKDKFQYFNKRFNTCNPKLLWKNVNIFMGRQKENKINIINVNNRYVTQEKEIVEIFNAHFMEKNNIQDISTHLATTDLCLSFSRVTFALFTLDEFEIARAIMNMKSSSKDCHNINSTILKHLLPLIVPVLSHLFNKFVDFEHIPAILKQSVVFCLNKSGKRDDINDYRGISIGSCILKVFESVLFKRMLDFTLQQNLISVVQFGFRPGSNTERALLELITLVRTEIDKNKKISCLFLDLKAAFDLVDWKLLLATLDSLGFRGTINNLLCSYLHDRKQSVRINDSTSSAATCKRGLPQGSVLSPLLFILFINSITSLKLNGKLILYADDIVLINNHATKEDVTNKINEDMTKLKSHIAALKLQINAEKTKLMIFQSSRANRDMSKDIKLMENVIIERVECFKYLGILLDENLKFDDHVGCVQNKVAQACGVLWKCKYDLPRHIKEYLYFGLIHSHLIYGNIIWGNCADSVIKDLQIQQNRAIRNIYLIDSRKHRVSMYSDLRLSFLPMRAIHFFVTTTFINNAINDKIHTNIHFTKASDSRSRTTRNTNSNRLNPIKTKTAFGAKAITHYGPKMYNSLDISISEEKNKNSFKWKIKKYLHEDNNLERCFNGNLLSDFC
jgi:hypothetical protein